MHFIIISFSCLMWLLNFVLYNLGPTLSIIVKLWQNSRHIIYSDFKRESRGLIHPSCLHHRSDSFVWSLPLCVFFSPKMLCWNIKGTVLRPPWAHLLPRGSICICLGCWSCDNAGRDAEEASARVCCQGMGQGQWMRLGSTQGDC